MANLGINTSTSAKAAQSDATTAMSLQDSSPSDYGDFVGSDEECEIEEVAEPLDRYYKGLQGLYYPIRIGQVLDQTYRIEHKLGHGGFSTVWLAYDMKNKRNVALKIIVPGNVGENELRVQNKIISTKVKITWSWYSPCGVQVSALVC
jgi:serine/threonine protein kinase